VFDESDSEKVILPRFDTGKLHQKGNLKKFPFFFMCDYQQSRYWSKMVEEVTSHLLMFGRLLR
jgi:hypothetical protein